MNNGNKRFYRPRDLVDMLGVSRSQAYKMCEDGQIPSIKRGKCWLIPVRALERRLSEWESQAEQRTATGDIQQ
jgi:excisionase family DNA binding protein